MSQYRIDEHVAEAENLEKSIIVNQSVQDEDALQQLVADLEKLTADSEQQKMEYNKLMEEIEKATSKVVSKCDDLVSKMRNRNKFSSSTIAATFMYLAHKCALHVSTEYDICEELDFVWMRFENDEFEDHDTNYEVDEYSFEREENADFVISISKEDLKGREGYICKKVLEDIEKHCLPRLYVYKFVSDFLYFYENCPNRFFLLDNLIRRPHKSAEYPNEIFELCKSMHSSWDGTCMVTNGFEYNMLDWEAEDMYDLDTLSMAAAEEYCIMSFAQAVLEEEDFVKLYNVQYKYDHIIHMPLFDAAFYNEDADAVRSFDWQKFDDVSRLTDAGESVSIVPGAAMSYVAIYTRMTKPVNLDSFKKTGEKLVFKERNCLDTIIMLPRNVFSQTSSSTFVVKFRNGREPDEPIKMIDATSMFVHGSDGTRKLDVEAIKNVLSSESDEHLLRVSLQEIWDNEDNVNPAYYFAKAKPVPEGYKVARLNELIKEVDGRKVEGYLTTTYCIRSSDLPSSIFDYELDVPEVIDDRDWKNRPVDMFTRIEEPVLLSAEDGSHLSFCKASKANPLFIAEDVRAYKVTTRAVTLPYLVYAIYKAKEEMRNLLSRRYCSLSEFLNLNIVYPSIEMQTAIVVEAKKSHYQAQLIESGFMETIQRMKSEYIDEVRIRKHDMTQPLKQLEDTAPLLRHYVNQLDGNPETVANLRRCVSRQQAAINSLKLQLQRLSEEDKFGTPEAFEVKKALEEIVPTSDRYHITFQCDQLAFDEIGASKVRTRIAPTDFHVLVSNVLHNAEHHGFTDSARMDYQINITVLLNPDKKTMSICFGNNGTPFPEGMDAKRYGLKGEKAGKTGGTGVGGYQVRSIAEHYGGSIAIVSSKELGYSIVSVTLPILFDDEKI